MSPWATKSMDTLVGPSLVVVGAYVYEEVVIIYISREWTQPTWLG